LARIIRKAYFKVVLARRARRCYNFGMKLILIVVVLGAGIWYVMTRAKDNAAVQAVTDSPLQYTKSLQNDEAKAKAAVEAAGKAIQSTGREVEKAAEAQ
jgi:alpha-D-ribose 1-methylphosphonate 5-triphosphate synthase subunit PhnG